MSFKMAQNRLWTERLRNFFSHSQFALIVWDIVAGQPGEQTRYIGALLQVDVFILKATPEPFNEDVVHSAAAASHKTGFGCTALYCLRFSAFLTSPCELIVTLFHLTMWSSFSGQL